MIRDGSSNQEPDIALCGQPVPAETLAVLGGCVSQLQDVCQLYVSSEGQSEPLAEAQRLICQLAAVASESAWAPVAGLGAQFGQILECLRQGKLELIPELGELLLESCEVIEGIIRGCAESEDVERIDALFALVLEESALSQQEPAAADSFETAFKKPVLDLDERSSIPKNFLETFQEEAEDHLKFIKATLADLNQAGNDSDLLHSLRCTVHTLKGAAGAAGLLTASHLAHRMEDLLDKVNEQESEVTPETLALWQDTVEIIEGLAIGDFDRESTELGIVQLYEKYAVKLDDPVATRGPAQDPSSLQNQTEVGVEKQPEMATEVIVRRPPQRAAQLANTAGPVSGRFLRVPVSSADELVGIFNEMIINQGAVEERLRLLERISTELHLTLDRLRGLSSQVDCNTSRLGATLGRRLPGDDRAAPHDGRNRLSAGKYEEFDPLEFDRYTELDLISRSLEEATGDVNTIVSQIRCFVEDFHAFATRQGRLARECQNKLMQIRMVPLSTLSQRLHQSVRSVTSQQDKKVELSIEGEDVRLDKHVIGEIADALMHLLRNAACHGIEAPDQRMAGGKPAEGHIRIRAFHHGTHVVIEVADDGRGLDSSRIRHEIVNSGILQPDQADALGDAELFEYIFRPGFSTVERIDEVSGRGLGMDIVRRHVHRVKGTIQVDSQSGRGTTFTIRLPVTLAVIRALLVHAEDQTFAIPMESVSQVLQVDPTAIKARQGLNKVQLNDESIRLVRLTETEPDPMPHAPQQASQSVPIILVNAAQDRIALLVDRVLSGREIVVKSLGNHLRCVPGLVGATILGDGTVVPILNPLEIVRLQPACDPPPAEPAQPEIKTVTVMAVDDSLTIRKVMTQHITSVGWNAVVAKDGVDALEQLKESNLKPDIFFLDIEMPRRDGYELLADLRGHETFRNTPVVMVTSRSGAKHRQKALDLGATDFVVKPCQKDALVSLVERLVLGTRPSNTAGDTV